MLDVLRKKGNPSRASIARDAPVDIGSRSARAHLERGHNRPVVRRQAVPASRLLMGPHTASDRTQPSSEAQRQIVGVAVTE
jgi:hypothetical protein